MGRHSGVAVAIILYLLVCRVKCSIRRLESLKERVPIGAIFPPNTVAEVSFVSALERASLESEHYFFTPLIVHVPEGDVFAAVKAACNLTAEGVIAVYGPDECSSASAVASRCRNSGIPHAVWRRPPPRGSQPTAQPSLNLYPEALALSRAVAHFIQDSDWTTYTLLYDEPDGLIRLQEILKRAVPEHTWRMRRLVPGEDNRPMLKALVQTGENHVILDCPADRVMDYLRQAREVNFFQDYMTYVLTSLDAHTLDLTELRGRLSNVTCLRVFDPNEPRARSYFSDWRINAGPNVRLPKSPEQIPVEAALANDAARMITDAVEKARDILDLKPQPLPCDTQDKWSAGEEFLQHLLTNPITGITDRVEVSQTSGERINFNLDIMELYNEGFSLIAKWNASTGFVYTRSENQVSNVLAEKWQKTTFKVVSRIGAPYLVERVPEEGQTLVGNDRYEGYSKDLIHEVLKEQLNLTYELEIVPDNNYGSYNKETKKWDGLVRHLIDRKAHLALCDLTITYERRSAVDFTTPFLTLGISILYSKPAKPPPDLFSFLKPFSVDVWIFTGTAYIMVSLTLHVLARMAPNDWENPHPCNKSPEELENIWDIKNSLWLTMGSIMTQGSDLLPKGYSTRMVAGMWWFFALIMCSSYTANLAAFLTNAAMDDSIKSAEDLAGQTKIKYGVVAGGSTASFFKRSNVSTYQRMWTAMEATRPSVFCKNNDEGVKRVLTGKRQFAFFMESTAIEYVLQRNCELMQVGGLLDSKGYGIAMPFESSYRTAVDNAILKLAESGKLVELKNKWWALPEDQGLECEVDDDGADSGELGVDNVGGVFVVLGLGCGICAAVGALEFLWHVKEVAVEQKMSQKDAFWAEFKFALSFWETEKPAHHSIPSSSPKSSRSPSVASRASSVLRGATSLFRLDMFSK